MTATKPDSRVLIARNEQELYSRVVQKVLTLSRKKVKEQGRFTFVLSGGSTPKGIYRLMASNAYRKKFAWEKIHFFWEDERWVSWSHSRSNFKMVADTLLAKVGIPTANIHAIKTDTRDAATSARLYEKELRKFFGLRKQEFPRFDLILLGFGEDGHTASLFPGHPALREKKRLAVAVTAKGIPKKRITLTLPVINNSQHIFFVVSGRKKAPILKAVLSRKKEARLPSQLVRPVRGELLWFVDRAASHGWREGEFSIRPQLLRGRIESRSDRTRRFMR